MSPRLALIRRQKKRRFFLFKYFSRTCTQTRGDQQKMILIKNVFQGMLNNFDILSKRKKSTFLSGGGPYPAPPHEL